MARRQQKKLPQATAKRQKMPLRVMAKRQKKLPQVTVPRFPAMVNKVEEKNVEK
jgi:hypothetical protein